MPLSLNQYFTDNFDEILTYAENIFKTTEVDPRDVVTELFINMSKDERNLPEDQDEWKFWMLRVLKNWTWHKGGNPIKSYKIKDSYTEDRMFVDIAIYDMDETEVTADLKRVGFEGDQIEKINTCIDISRGMPLYFKRLFVLYYLEGMTMEDIGLSCGLPKASIYTQLLQVQNYVKDRLELNPQKKLFIV